MFDHAAFVRSLQSADVIVQPTLSLKPNISEGDLSEILNRSIQQAKDNIVVIPTNVASEESDAYMSVLVFVSNGLDEVRAFYFDPYYQSKPHVVAANVGRQIVIETINISLEDGYFNHYSREFTNYICRNSIKDSGGDDDFQEYKAALLRHLKVFSPIKELVQATNVQAQNISDGDHVKAKRQEENKCGTPFAINGLNFVKVPGDGSCFYHAVGLYLGKEQRDLRRLVAVTLALDIDEYEAFITASDYETKDQYIQSIEKGNKWAEDVEIVVLARALNRPIVVIGPEGHIRNHDEVLMYKDKKPIFVSYNGTNHYDGFILQQPDGGAGSDILEALLRNRAVGDEVKAKQPVPVKSGLFKLVAVENSTAHQENDITKGEEVFEVM